MVSCWLSVCPSVHLSYICPYCHFRTTTSVHDNGFLPNLVCALILWRSGLGSLMGKFWQFLTSLQLSACDTSIFSFPDDNFSKYQWIFTKLGMCIDIVENCFENSDGQISSVFDSYLAGTYQYFHFWTITFLNINGFSPNFVCALILWRCALRMLMGKFCGFLTELFARNISVFSFLDDNFSKY